MFAVFECPQDSKKHIPASVEYTSPAVAAELKTLLEEKFPEKRFKVRQKVKGEFDKRGSWQDFNG